MQQFQIVKQQELIDIADNCEDSWMSEIYGGYKNKEELEKADGLIDKMKEGKLTLDEAILLMRS